MTTPTTPGHRRTKAETYFAAICRHAAHRGATWAEVAAELAAYTTEEWGALVPHAAEPGPTMRARLRSVVQVLADVDAEVEARR